MRLLFALFLLIASGPAFADPALWAVRGAGATVYLFGSIHMLRPGTNWESPVVRRAFDESSDYWFELADPDDPKAASLVQSLGMDPSHQLSAELPPASAAKLRQLAGANMGTLDHMRPWLAGTFLTITSVQHQGFDGQYGVEKVLMAQARQQRKPVHGLETLEGQIRLLASIPDARMLPVLVEEIDEEAAGVDHLERLAALWMAGDSEGLGRLVNKETEHSDPALTRTLLTDRNRDFATAIEAMLRAHTNGFVTVGAGHLSGPDGVPALLKARGLTIERVE